MAISRAGSSATGRTKSASPVATAARGMPSNRAVSSVCTMTMPPYSLIERMPRAPSLPVPDRTMPTAFSPWSSPSELKKTSMGRLIPRSLRSCSLSCSLPWNRRRFLRGGMM